MSDFDITVAGELNPENIEYLSELGVTRIVAQIPSETRDTVLPMLDGWAEIIERYQA